MNKSNCTNFQAFNAYSTKQLNELKNHRIFTIVPERSCHIFNLSFHRPKIFENYKLIFLTQTTFQVRKNFDIGDDDIYWIYCFFSGR